MDNEYYESMWLDERYDVTLDELVDLCDLSLADLNILIEAGALIPLNVDSKSPQSVMCFSSQNILVIRQLSRLKQAFELEPNALGLVMVFIERIQRLEAKLKDLKHLNAEYYV